MSDKTPAEAAYSAAFRKYLRHGRAGLTEEERAVLDTRQTDGGFAFSGPPGHVREAETADGIARLRLGPHDAVILRVRQLITTAIAERIKANWRAIFTEVGQTPPPLIILEPDVEISVLARDAPGLDTRSCVVYCAGGGH